MHAAAADGGEMGGSRAQVNKPHKSRFASQSSRHAHKIAWMQICDQKRAALLKEKRSSIGSSSAPHVIVLQAPYDDLTSCMELSKVADLLVFVLSANSLYNCDLSSLIDEFGSQCLSVFRAMGLSSTAVFIRDLPSDNKSRQELKKAAISFLSPELPEDWSSMQLTQRMICIRIFQFMWLFKEQHLSSPHWRNQRSYIMSEKACIKLDNSKGLCTLLVSGYLRVHNLSVNQLVHVSGAGDFELGQINVFKDPFPIGERKNSDAMDSEDNGVQIVDTFVADPMNQEPLLVENIPNPLAGEQTWLTEAEMEEAYLNKKNIKLVKRRLPRGTSEYQAAWIVDNTDDEDGASENDNKDGAGMVIDEQDHSDHGGDFSDIDAVSHFTEKFDEEIIGGTEMAVSSLISCLQSDDIHFDALACKVNSREDWKCIVSSLVFFLCSLILVLR